MKNKPFFIAATHGDETIGVDVLQRLSQKQNIDWIIGNPEAFRRGNRYYEMDLNRSAPGDPQSKTYEGRRAADIIDITKQYPATIDIHGTDCPCGIVTLVTNPTKENLILAASLSIDTIIIWPSVTPEMKYPSSEFFPCGVEIECGSQKETKTAEALTNILDEFLKREMWQKSYDDATVKKMLNEKTVYRMYDSIKKDEAIDDALIEMEECRTGKETFTPMFLGTYEYKNILGYKLEKLNTADVNEYLK